METFFSIKLPTVSHDKGAKVAAALVTTTDTNTQKNGAFLTKIQVHFSARRQLLLQQNCIGAQQRRLMHSVASDPQKAHISNMSHFSLKIALSL